jgi:internalin A
MTGPVVLLAMVFAAAPDAALEPLVRSLSGTVEPDRFLLAEASFSIKMPALTDAGAAKLCKHPQIGSLTVLDGTKLTVKAFADLRELPKLQKLIVQQSLMGDPTMAEIGRMASLRQLYLGNSKITDAGLAKLKDLDDLRVLDLFETAITDRGLSALAELKSLEDLNLSGTKIGDAGVVNLKGCKSLAVLKLTRTNATQKGISELEAALPKLIVRQ